MEALVRGCTLPTGHYPLGAPPPPCTACQNSCVARLLPVGLTPAALVQAAHLYLTDQPRLLELMQLVSSMAHMAVSSAPGPRQRAAGRGRQAGGPPGPGRGGGQRARPPSPMAGG